MDVVAATTDVGVERNAAQLRHVADGEE